MPTFTEGEDPRDQGMNASGRMPIGPEPAPPPSVPPLADTISAAFRQYNPVQSLFDSLSRASSDTTPVPGYDPIPRLMGTKYESLVDQSLGDQNPSETDARMAKFDGEDMDRQTLAASGFAGTVASVVAGATDPSWFVPILGEANAARELSVGARIARGMTEGAAKSTISEAGLQASQVSRTPGQAAQDIATNTLLMGFLGAAAKFLEPEEHAGAVKGLDEMRQDLTPREAIDPAQLNDNLLPPEPAPPEKETVPVGVEPSPLYLARDIGAAASDQRDMQLSRIGLPATVQDAIRQLPGGSATLDWVTAANMRLSPTLRVFSSSSVVAKRAMGDLAETALRFTQAARGIPTAQGGVPVDRLVRMQQHDGQLTGSQILRDQFIAYRGITGKLPMAQTALADARGLGGGALTFDQFKKEVTLASSDGDVHAIPQVATAAQQIRARVNDPITKMAQRVMGPDGRPMLADALAPPKGDKSFFPRLWNKQALAGKYNQAKKVFADWLEGEQGKKAAIKDNLVRWNGLLQNSTDRIDSLTRQIEGRESALQDIEGRQEEVARFNKFAFQRSAELSQPLDDMRARVRTIEQTIEPQLMELGQLAQDIKDEKVNLPHIKDADALIFKMIGAAQKLKESKSGLETVEGVEEYIERLDDTISGFKGGIREAATQAKMLRMEPGTEQLVALEKSKAALRKEVGPYLTELRKIRRNLRDESERKTPGARGGAVFETEIRNRGNALADRASGRRADLDKMTGWLADERDNQDFWRSKIEEGIGQWEGKSSMEAKAAIARRAEAEQMREAAQQAGTYQGRGERLSAADRAIDSAVRNIAESHQDLSRENLESRAAEIINRINAAPDGRIPYDLGSGGPQMGPPGAEQNPVRGSLNSRDFAIPTHLVKDFIETDTEHVLAAHLRTAIPDIHLTDRFGDVEMQDVFRRLNEEYDAKANGITDEKKLTALDNERKAMNRDLAATRDRLRGTYGWELAKTQPNAARIANAARNYNIIADLGTSVFNRMNDATNAVWRYGLMSTFADGYIPFFNSLVGMNKTFLPAARQSMQDMGVGVDSAIGHLSHQFGDVISNVKPGSKFERALAWSASKSMMLNLHGPWTDSIKTVAGTIAAANLLRTAERMSLGTGTAEDIAQLARSGIEPGMATRIWDAYKGPGGGQEFGKGTHVANTAAWKDAQARQIFSSAIGRDADMSVLNPGMEKPLWMSGPVVSLLGQYKSFVAAAHEKILIANLQQMDVRTLQGLVASLGMGMLSYRAYTLLSGAPASDRPQDWIKEAISRSAMLGWYTEVNSMQAKFTGGATDMFRAIGADHPLSRRSSNGALSEMLGPTYAKLEGLAGGLNDASHGTWTATDTHNLRQAMFLQNLYLTRGLLNDVEDGFNQRLGIKPLNRGPGPYPNTINTQP